MNKEHSKTTAMQVPYPTILVIFGVTGDLARKKLIPALFSLYKKGILPSFFQIVGFSRREMTDEDLREEVTDILKEHTRDLGVIRSFVQLFVYRQGFFDRPDGYGRLAEFLGRKDNEWKVCANKLFYLAVPPDYYETISTNLSFSGLTEPCGPDEGWTRVIVEKPFGRDLKTAEALDSLLGKLFKEEQIYRIDHYLGKETVQNILAFRFSNSFLAPAWDHRSIERIDVAFSERGGIGTRGAFYDATGALRDVGQNHILQLLALFTMERPEFFTPESIREKRLEALQSLHILKPHDVEMNTIRGQYEGYRDEAEVASASATETYFSIKTSLLNKTWKDVPVYLTGGKELAEDKVEVVLTFRHQDPCLCPPEGPHYQNVLRYRVQPDEGISLSFWVKRPGNDMVIEEKDFGWSFGKAYSKELFVDAYEKLLLDAFEGNQTLFVSTKEVKASWKFIDPIVEAWQKDVAPLIFYAKGATPEEKS